MYEYVYECTGGRKEPSTWQLHIMATSPYRGREKSTCTWSYKTDIHSNMRHLRGDHMPCNNLVLRWENLREQTYCIFFFFSFFGLQNEGGKKNLWLKRNSATKGYGRKWNSDKCTCEKRIRPMYMHTKWWMQFCRKRCKKICAHFLHYVVKASHVYFFV